MNPSNSDERWFADFADSYDEDDLEAFEDADYGDDVLEADVEAFGDFEGFSEPVSPGSFGGSSRFPRFFAGEGQDTLSPIDEGTAAPPNPPTGSRAVDQPYAEDPGSPPRAESYGAYPAGVGESPVAATMEDPGSPPRAESYGVYPAGVGESPVAATMEDPGSPPRAENFGGYQEDIGESPVAAASMEDPGGPAGVEGYSEDLGESAPGQSTMEDPGSPPVGATSASVPRAEYSEDTGSAPARWVEHSLDAAATTPVFQGLDAADDEFVEHDPLGAETVSFPTGFRTGVWLDVGGTNLDRHLAQHVTKLRALRIQDACVMINSDRATSFGYGATPKSVIGRLAPALAADRIGLTLTSWLRPDRAFIDALVADLPAYAMSLSAKAIEFDVEAPWTQATPRGFANHAQAAEHLFRGLETARRAGLEVSVTYVVDTATSDRMRRLLQLADVVVPQAYSANPRGATPAVQRTHGVRAPYGPVGLQTRALDRLEAGLAAPSSKDVIMGLAAYARDRWSGHRPDAILGMEANAAVALAVTRRVTGIRYWSWKWVAGHDGRGGMPANSYAERFLSGLVAAAPANPTTASAPTPQPRRPAAPSVPTEPVPEPGTDPTEGTPACDCATPQRQEFSL